MRHSRMRPRRRLGVLCDAARSPPAVLGAPKPQKELGLACWGSRVEDNQGALVTAFRPPDLCLRPPQLQPRDDGVRGGDTSRPPTARAAACAACAGEAPVRSCRSPHVGRSRAPPWAAANSRAAPCGGGAAGQEWREAGEAAVGPPRAPTRDQSHNRARSRPDGAAPQITGKAGFYAKPEEPFRGEQLGDRL